MNTFSKNAKFNLTTFAQRLSVVSRENLPQLIYFFQIIRLDSSGEEADESEIGQIYVMCEDVTSIVSTFRDKKRNKKAEGAEWLATGEGFLNMAYNRLLGVKLIICLFYDLFPVKIF